DLYKSKGMEFIVDGNKLIPPFNSLAGVGDNAAIAIEEAAKSGEFFSKEDFKQRTKATRTAIDALEAMGCFKNLGETNQISFFNL
ncbi:MAG: PolC-type DNA polymerase III, partial [Clostridiaceae bacterium]